MLKIERQLQRWLFCVVVAVAAISFCVLPPPAMAGSYLDAGTPDLKPEERIKLEQPKPVQLLFQFQSNGDPNARATDIFKTYVTQAVQNSGLFSVVTDGPADGGAVLSVTINNIFDKKGSESKGFVTGLTFGLAGNVLIDNYLCTVDYLAGTPGAAKITKTARHAIYTTVGFTASPPATAVKAKNLDDAVLTMTRQIVETALNSLAGDRAFNPNAPLPVTSTTPAAPALPPAASATQPAATTPASQPAVHQ
ncbi:MAG: hypothetical protein HY243_01695 [Proteobacteria bacterium]|nr:hypothetical protein [Pseudomonadota bacterium]